jgi:eukaryotic-like serine/threonine-protein kinase
VSFRSFTLLEIPVLGQTVSHYRILEKLGEGGMGVVYKAQDTKLNRTVALKFLPSTILAGDEERKRFSREAQAAAALNHPNIATVFAIDEADDQTFISLELVEGQSLDKRIASGPLKHADTLDFATQICEGLQAAHEKGIVHRDIKSANIMITETGRVKILDFGLAKLKGVSRVTKEGTTLGTMGYMSPEQLRGEAVDQRTDIWSTGVLLYEMVSGHSPFSGDYEQAITYQILNELPEPLTAVRTGVPMELERVVHKMLAKKPGERYQSVKEILVDLKVAGLTLTKGPSSHGRAQIYGRPRSKSRQLAVYAAVGCLGALLGGGAIWVAVHNSLAPVASHQMRILTVATGNRIEEAVISPDGSQVAYTKKRLLYIRNLSHVGERAIEGTAGAKAPFWSPGGDAIGYGTETYLWRIPAAGGEPVALCKISRNYLGAYWDPSGHIIFAMAGTGIFSIPEQGGEPRNVLAPDSSQGDFDFHSPYAAPDGESMLAVLHGKDNWVSKVLVLRGQTRRTILEIPNAYLSRPTYSSTGHLLFSEDSPRYGIWAIEFSPTAEGSLSEPFMVKDGAHSPSVSLDGTLVCVAGPRSVQQMAWVSRSGRIERFIGEPLDQLRQPMISPDGKKVAVAAYLNGVMDIWIYDLQQGTQTRLPTEGSLDMEPVWSPGSDTLAFQTGKWGGTVSIVRTRAEAGGVIDTLLTGSQNLVSWSRDGKFIVYVKDQQIAYIDLRESKPKPRYVDVSAKVSGARLSPDGRYVAFVSEETGRREVYLAPFPGGGRKWRASLRGGEQPKWAKGGKELIFLVQDKLTSVSFDDHPAVRIGTPQILFSPDSIRGYLSLFSWRWYDPSPDGEHFVVVTETESSNEEASVLLLENWQAGIGSGKKP